MTQPTDILQSLRDVIDPEIGMTIAGLGLVDKADVVNGVDVVLTMATPACPLGESIIEESTMALRRHVPGARAVSVDLGREPAMAAVDEVRRRPGATELDVDGGRIH
jgi:metal-sulfur cluster biosynthetic enzyme